MVKKIVSSFFICSFFCLAGTSFSQQDFYVAKVHKVLSGNRLLLRGGTIVEYAGIDVPASNNGNANFREIGNRALKLNQSLVQGKTVRFEFLDAALEGSAKQAYVFSGGTFVNAGLLKSGLAVVQKDFDSGEKYFDYFLAAQKQAIQGRKGIWQYIEQK